MPPFHGGDQGFDPPTDYLKRVIFLNDFRSFNGRTEVFGAFNWSSNLYRKICLGNSMVECLTCNEVVGGSIPLLSLVI